MIYQFEDVATGEAVDVEMPVAEAVDLGDTIELEGRTLRRSIIAPTVAPVVTLEVHGWQRAPGSCPGATAYKDPITGKVTTKDVTGEGVPLYDSRSDMQRTERLTEGRETFQQLK